MIGIVGGTVVRPRTADRQRRIVELAYHIAKEGQPPTGPVAMAVTEGREQSQYAHGWGSSCVELADCVMFAAGCRAECINRDEHLGRRTQTDLGWYLKGSKHDGKIIHSPKKSDLSPGDLLGYDFYRKEHGRGAHAAIFLCWLTDGRALTADYGQPGGRVYKCKITQVGKRLISRGRMLDGVVKTNTLSFPGPCLTVGEWLEFHGLPMTPWVPYGLIGVEE